MGVITQQGGATTWGWQTPLNSWLGNTSLNQGWSFKAGEDIGASLYYDTHVSAGIVNGSTAYCYGNYRVKWGDGHTVSYPAIRTNCDYSYLENHGPSGSQAPSGNYCFSDRSVLQVPNSGSPTLYMEDGTKVFPTEDSNGNMIGTEDTVGRTVPSAPGPATSSYTYHDSAGNAQNIQFIYQNVPITPSLPSFGSGGTYVPPGSTTWSMLTAVILANGDRWDFRYNNNGELSGITYPSGGFTGYT